MSQLEKLYDVFISYASKDITVADKVCSYLESVGHLCWIAPRNIEPSNDYAAEIIKGLESSKILLLILSKNSNESEQVLREVERAAGKRIRIVVLNIQYVEALSKSLEYFITQRQWIRAYDNSGKLDLSSYVLKITSDTVERFKNSPTDFAVPENAGVVYKPRKQLVKQLMYAFMLMFICFILVLNIKNVFEIIGFTGHRNNSLVKKVDVLKEGDIITFGNYRGNPLNWAILKNRAGRITLIAVHPIAYKPYDVAHGGIYSGVDFQQKLRKYSMDSSAEVFVKEMIRNDAGEQFIYYRGSSDWRSSVLHTWLNSAENNVNYPSVKPGESNFNYYDYVDLREDINNITEPGFLNSFSKEQLRHMVPIEGTMSLIVEHKKCKFYSKPLKEMKLSDLYEEMWVFDFINNDTKNCYRIMYNELVTIPSKSDVAKIVAGSEDMVDYSYYSNGRKVNLKENVSFWTKNPCGITPSAVCVVSGSNSNKNVITVKPKNVTDMAGVLPIIKLNLIDAMYVEGMGRVNMPYVIRWREK